MELNKIVCMDNLLYMKSLPNESIDLVYCDILYATGKNFGEYQDIKNDKQLVMDFYTPRFKEIHRLLKNTGAFYCNCDYKIQHFIRLICDDIFGFKNLRNEIIWCYKTTLKTSKMSFGKDHDNIYFYAKSKQHKINPDRNDFPSSESTVKRWGKYADKNGFVSNKHFSKSSNNSIANKTKEDGGFNINYGIPRDWWEISSNVAKGNTNEVEYGKYPTQKPKKLLERIIKTSSNKGDIIADFFCGSGVTGVVAKELNRSYLLCDINPRAIQLTNLRLSS